MIFDIHDPDIEKIKSLNHLKLNFIHLNEHKFRHNFNDTVDPMCPCGLESETSLRRLHYFLRCNLYLTEKLEHLSNVCILNSSVKNYSNENLLKTLLYGSEDTICDMNREILKVTIKFLKRPERFNGSLFWPFLNKYLS